MNRCKIVLSVLWIQCVVPLLPIAFAVDIDRTWWDRAVAIAEKNKSLTPLNILETETVTKENGRPVEQSATHVRVFRQPGSSMDIRLVSRKENGRDVTALFLKQFTAYKEEIGELLNDDGVFGKSTQPFVELTHYGTAGNIAVYRFTLEVDGTAVEGEAEIDTLTGHPVSDTLSSPVIKEGDIILTNYIQITRYMTDGDQCYAQQIHETMNIEIKGLFTGFKGHVETKTLLTDYVSGL